MILSVNPTKVNAHFTKKDYPNQQVSRILYILDLTERYLTDLPFELNWSLIALLSNPPGRPRSHRMVLSTSRMGITH